MHFDTKSYLKSNRNHTVKQTLKCWDKRKKVEREYRKSRQTKHKAIVNTYLNIHLS
jgi:hypothetical protein